ncbi:hypothetical protein KAJ83_01205 [Marivibrio halodurans]|uniref:Uncharacterized protein n=1 Tax=Marivibrio halodurans TaxID=2039722 RepID=A0A8J7S2Q0_9PROT|nr:hypothetical protein [Marivibrio halodurans]MBP5855609.1 hypothetical protein [Marivibrio halodurans]
MPSDLAEYLKLNDPAFAVSEASNAAPDSAAETAFSEPSAPTVPPSQADHSHDMAHLEVAYAEQSRVAPYYIKALRTMPKLSRPLVYSSEAGSLWQIHANALGAYFQPASLRLAEEAAEAISAGDADALDNDVLFARALVAEAYRRRIPFDLTAQVLRWLQMPENGGIYHSMKQQCFRRLVHWHDVGALVAMINRRRFGTAIFSETSQKIDRHASDMAEHGTTTFDPLLTERQLQEVYDYFLGRPVYNGHTAENRLDNIQRFVGYGAEAFSYGSYSLADSMAAPHLLELSVDPTLLEVGRRHLGGTPLLSKIYVHWDFPHTDHLVPDGVTIGDYHRDLNDFGMFWVYMYLSDVDMESGPHALIPGSHRFDVVAKRLEEALRKGQDFPHLDRNLTVFDFFDGYGYHIPQSVKLALFEQDQKFFTGPPGTILASNGFQLHKIHQPQSKRRLIVALRYQVSMSPRSSALRECDSVPEHLVAGRVNMDLPTRQVLGTIVNWKESPYYRASDGAAGTKAEKKNAATSRRALKGGFLFIGNGRTGSTWVTTLLNQLPGVASDFEYRWSLPKNATPDEVHRMVPDMSGTFLADFATWSGTARYAGSKLIFSLEENDLEAAIEGIRAKLDRKVTPVLLTRPYSEVLLSFRFRGPTHRLAKDGRTPRGKESVMLRRLRETAEAGPSYPTIPRDELMRNLFQLAMNDVIGYAIVLNRPDGYVLEYRNIGEQFEDLVKALKIDVPNEVVAHAPDDPAVRKLPALDASAAPNFKAVRPFAETLFANLQDCIRERAEWRDLLNRQIEAARSAGLTV